MKIKETHDTILFYLNKSQNGDVSREEIDLVLDRVQMDKINELIRDQDDQPIARKKKSTVSSLSPFVVKYPFTTILTPAGVLTLPSDFLYISSMMSVQYVNALSRNVVSPVQVLREDELVERLESQVVPVSMDDPIAILNGNKVQLFPENPQSGILYYYKRPAKPKFHYTMVGRVVQHDANLSTDLEWSDLDCHDIIVKTLSYFGINLSNQELVQVGELKDAQLK